MRFPHRPTARRAVVCHDARLGHRFVQNVCARVAHERGAYYVRTNAQGFREDHDFAPKGPGFRIAFYGDSFTAGDGVSNDERFSDRTGAQLGVEALNLAVSGHGPDQATLLFEHTPVPDADLVVFCIAANTIDRIQSDRRVAMDRQGRHVSAPRPRFVLVNGQAELRGVPVPENVEVLRETELPRVESVYQARLRAIKSGVRRRLSPSLQRRLPSPSPTAFDDPTSDGWRLMAAIVARFHGLARGVPVVILPLPTRSQLIRGRSTTFQTRFDSLDRPADGLHVLNVTDQLLALPAAQRDALTFPFDAHPSPQGHAAAADALCTQLIARRLVEPAACPQRTPRIPTEPCDLALEVRWDHAGSAARIMNAQAQPCSEFIDEAALAGSFTCFGTLPLTAINECLEREELRGPELTGIRLISPASLSRLVALDLPREVWARALAPSIRWHGAAAVDLRALLRFEGEISHVETQDPMESLTTSQLSRAHNADVQEDEESRWLEQRLQDIWLRRKSPSVVARLMRLARHWELATRRARDAVSPTAAPGRRARLRNGRVG